MPCRDPAKAQNEASIFEAFIRAYPRFAAQVTDWYSSGEDEEIDIVTVQDDGTSIAWQLVEWLQDAQIAAARQREQMETAIMNAIENQGSNFTQHMRFCQLTLRTRIRRFDPSHADSFRAELMRLIHHIDTRWQSQQLHRVAISNEYPTLRTYLSSICSVPRYQRGTQWEYPDDQPWIVPENWGGPYRPQTAFDALRRCLTGKTAHYGGIGRADFRLLVYYHRALLYNTPFYGPGSRTFQEVAASAAQMVEKFQGAFTKIYLLKALNPALEAFEIYPRLRSCSEA